VGDVEAGRDVSPTPLTHRQIEVLELMAKGLTNPEIARILGIALGTVKHHVSAVIESLDATNRTEAVAALARLDLGNRLAGLTPVPGFGERPILALLPFEDLGGRPDDAWFVRGLVSDLTHRTGAVRWFPVIQFDSTHAPPDRAGSGDPFDARYRVQGSVLWDDTQVRVTLRVSEGDGSEPVWAERFERPRTALADLQGEIIDRIVGELEPALVQLEQIRARRVRAEELAVWDYCKRAEFWIERETAEGHRDARALFERALEIAPGSAAAWAGLGLAHASEVYLGLAADLASSAQRAREASTRAIDLAPEDFAALLSLGRSLALSREDAAAVPHLEAALELDPSSSLTCSTLAGALRREGEFDRATPFYERAIRLSPRSTTAYHAWGGLALAHFAAERFAPALACARRAAESRPSHAGGLDFYAVIPACLALLGRVDEARAAWRGAGARGSQSSMAHSARFVGKGLDRLYEGLRIAGWEGWKD
jgi:TolB-like protein/DNA-binding CsgD family transcriptional regulator/Tfp pilus assembly protein PilF